jgi:hypothetical protein
LPEPWMSSFLRCHGHVIGRANGYNCITDGPAEYNCRACCARKTVVISCMALVVVVS